MNTVAHQAARGHRTIRLPLAEADYERFLGDGGFAKEQLAELYGQHPELFPGEWGTGVRVLWVYEGIAQTRTTLPTDSATGER